MPHCQAAGCSNDHTVEKVLLGKYPEVTYWIIHVKTFYEIYNCFVANKKKFCKCLYNGRQHVFKCTYCGSIAAFEFAYEWFRDNNKHNYSMAEKVRVEMKAHWRLFGGYMADANIYSRKFIEGKEHLTELYIYLFFF